MSVTSSYSNYSKEGTRRKNSIAILDLETTSRERLEWILSGFEDFVVINQFESPIELYHHFLKSSPDYIFMEIDIPLEDGMDLIRNIKNKRGSTKVIVYTKLSSSEPMIQSLRCGADGYLLKEDSPTGVIQAISGLREGGAALSNTMTGFLVDSFHRNDSSPLTSRELHVVDLLSKGKNSTQIAKELEISKETARTHLKNIYKKLNINSKSEAVMMASEMRWI